MNLENKIINNKYRMLKQIGEGGMSFIWHAKYINMYRDVAIKILKNDVNKFFATIASVENGLVIIFDDLQWIDEGSISLIEELLKSLKNLPILIIRTYRNN